VIQQAARWTIRTAATRSPVTTYAAVGALARATAPLPASGRLPVVLPELSAGEVRRARRRVRSSEWRTRVLSAAMNSATGESALPPYELDLPRPDTDRPAVYVSLHVGAMPALVAFLRDLPHEAAALHRQAWRLPPNLVDIHVGRNERARVAGFHRALTTLRGGGSVCIPIEGDSVRTAVLGRSFLMARGPFALARLSGAPIVPLHARWSGGRVRIHAGRPIAADRDEQAMALGVGSELELYLRAHPGEIDNWLLTGLIDGHTRLPDL
jgi:hypothetical protein